MEHGSHSFEDDHEEKSSSDLNPQCSTHNVGAQIGLGDANDTPHNVAVHEDDHSMPITNLVRIMRKVLPPQAKVAEEAKEAMQVCVSEFISFITNEANERCHMERRRIVKAEDILWAMDSLGFDDYVGPLTTFLKRYRHNNEVENLGHLGWQTDVGYPISSLLSPPLSPQRSVARYGSNFPTGPSMSQNSRDV